MRTATFWTAGLVGLAIAVTLCGCCGPNAWFNPPQSMDADGDGVCDKDDICPGFDDRIDADGDGVPDGCDPCPNDNPDDTDGDGVCDSDDDCPGHDDAVDVDGDGRPDGCDVLVSARGYGEVEEKSCGLLTPTAADGWVFSGWTVDGVFQEAGPGDGAIKPAAPAVVVAVFRFDWASGVEPLDLWLEANPTVADALVWEGDLLDPLPARCGYSKDGPWCGEVHAWPWPGEAQTALFLAFERAYLDLPSGVSDVPPNAAHNTAEGDTMSHQEYFPEDAKAAFMAYAANSLSVEIRGLVQWSLLDGGMYGEEELAVLLDSRKFFNRQSDGNYKVSNVQHGGMSTMSAPETALAFLRGMDLPYADANPYFCRNHTLDDCDAVILSDTTAETIGNTIHWFRLNVIHFMGHWWYGNAEAHWQYRGYTPAVRLMTGTQRTEYISEGDRYDTRPDERIIPRTAGCWGTTGFMRTVLRAVNIPVVLETAGGHALPSFPSEARMGRPSHMSHGDDPYSMLVKTGEWPSYDLLMMKGDWEAWFRPPPAPGEPEPEFVDPTDEEVEDGFLDSLPPDIDYCGDPDCGYAPPPEPELEAVPGEPIVNTPKMWVGGRSRALTLSWTCWYVARKHCEGGQVPVEGADIALRNWTMAELMSLDCSALPLTGREGLPGEIQFCHGDFFEYLDDMIAGVGGCEAVGPGAGKHYYTYEVCTPMPEPPPGQ